MNSTIFTTDQVDQLIRDNAGKMTLTEMMSLSGRSENFVRMRAGKIGIQLRMDSELKRFIRENYRHMTCAEVAKIFNVEKKRCRMIALRMGVVFKQEEDEGLEIGDASFDRNGFFDESAYAKYCII